MLVPSQLMIRFGIHPIRLTNRDAQRMVHFTSEPGTSAFRFQVRHRADAQDPLFLLELQDNPQGYVSVAFMAANSPDSPRFDIRHGLRLLPHVMTRMEAFVIVLGQDAVLVEPLAYHNAIMFERHGFVYIQGQQTMERIHHAYLPEGELTRRLDNSTPFRAREAAASVRGRSWAIHDGILGEPWGEVKMVRRLGAGSSIDTAPSSVPW